jgi:hypothetical protein
LQLRWRRVPVWLRRAQGLPGSRRPPDCLPRAPPRWVRARAEAGKGTTATPARAQPELTAGLHLSRRPQTQPGPLGPSRSAPRARAAPAGAPAGAAVGCGAAMRAVGAAHGCGREKGFQLLDTGWVPHAGTRGARPALGAPSRQGARGSKGRSGLARPGRPPAKLGAAARRTGGACQPKKAEALHTPPSTWARAGPRCAALSQIGRRPPRPAPPRQAAPRGCGDARAVAAMQWRPCVCWVRLELPLGRRRAAAGLVWCVRWCAGGGRFLARG